MNVAFDPTRGLPWLILSIVLLPVWYYWQKFAPWVPMHKEDLVKIKELADLKPGQTFIDLGCGDGRVPLYIAENTDGNAQGVEIIWPLYWICKYRQRKVKNPRLNYFCRDLFKLDFSNYDVIYVFGMTDSLKQRFRDKCLKELKPHAKVISYCFVIEGWKPHQMAHGIRRLPIYIYTRSEQVDK